MASVTIQATAQCAGGNHITFSVTGAASRQVVLTRDELTEPVSQDDLDQFVRVLARLSKLDKTLAQWRTAMQNGVTVSA
jgi:hypothetical protein